MPLPTFEIATGAVNSSNVTFFTSKPYTAGTLCVYLNGQLMKNSAGDPWIETDPLTGEFTMAVDCIPQLEGGYADEIAVFYLDTTADFVGSEVTEITACIIPTDTLHGQIEEVQGCTGNVCVTNLVGAIVDDIEEISGTIKAECPLTGTITEC